MKILPVLISILLSACTTITAHQHANQLAQAAGLEKVTTMMDGFVLTAYVRIDKPNQPINVYIEGDGLAWFSRNVLSTDPTPRDAIGLALAAQDPASNVLYLARPCQFNDFETTPCNSAYWSHKRFAPEVIKVMNNELQAFVNQAQKIHLIGYSGGAAVATLLAAQRSDVLSLSTVAGNLDHAYVNQYHRVDLMPESLNAIDVAHKISHIPQRHFVAKNDQVIPPQVAKRFVEKQMQANQIQTKQTATQAQCALIIQVDAEHQKGWVAQWPQLLRTTLPPC